MKKYIYSLIFISLFTSCNTYKKIDHSKIYNEIYRCQGIDINDSIQCQFRVHQHLVKKIIKWDYLGKLGYSRENDTIYILEMDGIQDNFLFMVWNKKHFLSYTDESGELKQVNSASFTKHMRKLVSEWNILEIRREEKINKVILPMDIIYATKITINKGKYSIECLRFFDFFNIKRDIMPDTYSF